MGLVARDGTIPISDRQDTVGPIARTVKDAASLLTVIAGKSDRDRKTWDIPFERIPDYAACCETTDLTGFRLGVPRNAFPDVSEEIVEEFEKAVAILTKAGAAVVDTEFSSVPEWENWDEDKRKIVLEADFKEAMEVHLKSLVVNPNNIRTIEDLIDFTKSTPEESYPSRNVDRWLGAIRSANLPRSELQSHLEKMLRCSGEEGILGALEASKSDALIVPSTPDIPVTFAARTGLPIIAVPLGYHSPETPIKKTKRGDLIECAPGIP